MQPSFTFTYPQIDWLVLAPVSLVILTGIVALIIEMLRPKQPNDAIIGTSLAGLVLAAVSVFWQFGQPSVSTFNGMISRDQFGLVLQLILIGVCFICFLFSEGYLRQRRIAFAEFYPLALWSTAGGMIMVSTNNLLMIFLGLEVLSIALYCMAGMARDEAKSEESSLKYFLLGAFASAFLLMGIAFLYGATGSVQLEVILARIPEATEELKAFLIFGVILMLVGLGFKMALAPFHQWTPDVYQGAPTNVTAFMAAASKTAAVGMMIRFLVGVEPLQEFWLPILTVLTILTMTVGNLAALMQKDVKRILGYSSIANAGYVLVAILAHIKMPEKVSLATPVFFLAAYSLTTLGTLAVITVVARAGKEGTRFSDLHGLWKRSPFAAGIMVLFVASLIGIPPTGGFFGKYMIFADALKADLWVLALVLAVNSAISVAYYLWIVQAAFVDDEGAAPAVSGPMTGGLRSALVVTGVGVVFISFFFSPVYSFIEGPNQELRTEALVSPAERPALSGPAVESVGGAVGAGAGPGGS